MRCLNFETYKQAAEYPSLRGKFRSQTSIGELLAMARFKPRGTGGIVQGSGGDRVEEEARSRKGKHQQKSLRRTASEAGGR